MLVRSLTQAGRRNSITASSRPLAFFTSNAPTAAFNSSSTRGESSVPITSWTSGQRSQHEIPVKAEQAGEVVNLHRTAKPLDWKVYDRLTPTLNKFTLPGKVAVVTG